MIDNREHWGESDTQDIAEATDGYGWCHGARCMNTAAHIVEEFGRRGRRCEDCLSDHGAFKIIKTFDNGPSANGVNRTEDA